MVLNTLKYKWYTAVTRTWFDIYIRYTINVCKNVSNYVFVQNGLQFIQPTFGVNKTILAYR